MFEKSLVDLIRALRAHKGHEGEYIQSAISECRREIRTNDLDVKATALLKLVYLEMFGHDMSWAAFNVLEVMSSAKLPQKRVGYLAAVQSFGPETEVLMLAENLLKKDLGSPQIPVLGIVLTTIPHVVTAELALSILTELLPRLTHSQPGVRKKTVVALYRLALVYPETLRVSWPKIKERLMDGEERSEVTSACVNVVCELGWRNPRDFLNLAPRLFDLLTSDKNNWMSIKIIKLFAVLTPLEPRLIKKLARPLAKILRETGAMSLLYECISGIIQGGILDGGDMGVDIEEVADLCISKLRGMIVLEGDPNLKYVALLAFNKIVGSHPKMVSMQQDVILACLDDPDISIKMQALELVSGMVDSDNLQAVVNRLLKQLANAPKEGDDTNGHLEDAENTDLEQRLVADKRGKEATPIPDEYRHEIVSRILDMCSSNTYAHIVDFEWYIEILVNLVRYLPADKPEDNLRVARSDDKVSLGSRVGTQILDIAVRVKELRLEATRAAEKLVMTSNRSIVFASHAGGQAQILKSAGWICGEFAEALSSPYEVLSSLLHDSSLNLPASTLSIFIQAIPKVLSQLAADSNRDWNATQSSMLSLLLARTTTFLEQLSLHPNLEVQERAVEFLELLKVGSESLSSHPADSVSAPLLLYSVMPGLFQGQDLNPVSATAQSKVPIPADLDLDTPINSKLNAILSASQVEDDQDAGPNEFDAFYNEREPEMYPTTTLQPLSRPVSYMREAEPASVSYQSTPESPNTLANRKAERQARARDDPFYIAPPSDSGRDSPIHRILRQSNGEPNDLDIDAIPIIDLQLDPQSRASSSLPASSGMLDEIQRRKKKSIRKFQVAADETLDVDDGQTSHSHPVSTSQTSRSHSPASIAQRSRPTRNLLCINSNQLSGLSLSEHDASAPLTADDLLRRQAEEDEMRLALAEVERKRMEMMREEERKGVTYAEGAEEGVVVKRKKKKAKPVAEDEEGEGAVKKKKKKKKVKPEEGEGQAEAELEALAEGDVVKRKKKAKRKVGAPSATAPVEHPDDTAD